MAHRTKSIVKLIIFVFYFALKVVLPNIQVCLSEKLVLSTSLWSMLTKLFRSVRLSLLYEGQWSKKMNSRFNIIIAVTYKIECILEAAFEFMLSQLTKPNSSSCNIFDSDRIMTVKKQIRRRSYEF